MNALVSRSAHVSVSLTAAALALMSCRIGPQPSDPIPKPLRVDPHSFAKLQEWQTRHIELELAADFGQQVLEGFAILTIEAQRADAEPLLVLDTRELEILDVATATPAGVFEPALFRLGQHDPILGTPLFVDLPLGVLRVRVHYRTSPKASGLQWLEPSQTASHQPFLFSQSQAIHARSWIPCQDSPAVRTTYRASIAAPQGARAVMSAEQLGFDEPTQRWQFSMPQPIPSYLIAIAIGQLEFQPLGERTGVYAEPSVIASAAYELADTEKMIEAVEALYGPYRWGRYDLLVLPASFPFGGMENPRLTFATPTILAGDRSLVALIAHELAHSWSGNLVTNASWNDFWLNEGFTVYLEQRIIEAVYGKQRCDIETALGMRSLRATIADMTDHPEDTRLKLSLEGRDPDDGMTDIAYEKGAAFLRRLEEAVGRAKFDRFLRAWFDEHAFQSVTTEQFEQFLMQRLLSRRSTELSAIDWKAWIHGTGLPTDAPNPQSELLQRIEAQAHAYVAGSCDVDALGLGQWDALERLTFLRSLPKQVAPELMARLDEAFAFTQSTNNEILWAWLELAIRSPYPAANSALENFLTKQGRRKYLVPLYQALAESEEGLARARTIYAQARPLYHGIARGTIEPLLGL